MNLSDKLAAFHSATADACAADFADMILSLSPEVTLKSVREPIRDTSGNVRPIGYRTGLKIEWFPLLLNGKVPSYLNRQTNRQLIRWRRYIVKIGPGIEFGGIGEVKRMRVFAPEDRRFFNPIVAHGRIENDPKDRRWVAQPILPIQQSFMKYSNSDHQQAWETLQPLRERYYVPNVGLLPLGDQGVLCPWNWCIVEGQPVIFDYEDPSPPTSSSEKGSRSNPSIR